MYFQEDKVGYSHFKIEPAGRNFKIVSESTLRLTALKKTSEIRMKEKVMVRPDLTLISFESAVRMNDKDLKMNGRVEGGHFLLDMAVEGEKLAREYPVDGATYHSGAVSLMPAMRGLKDGGSQNFSVFNPEKQAMEKVEQQISRVAGEAGPNRAVWKVKTNYGRNVIHSWLDVKGLTVVEKSLDGSLITMLEDEKAAKAFLAKGTPGKDLVLDFSLIRVARPIPDSAKVRFLKIRMQGIDSSAVPNDHRQQVSKAADASASQGFGVTVRTEDPASMAKNGKPAPEKVADKYLVATMSIQADHKEIVSKASEIVSQRDSDLTKVTKLVHWTAKNIKGSMKDSFTALSVLRDREGECQAHANLYTALARAAKIPTRVVTGLVYTEEIGFLYHAWAESYVNGWLAVDPTLDQIPVDATHIKLYAGDSADDMNSLLKTAGKVKIEVQDFK